MTTQQWLAIAGAAAGSLGSIITAFSLNYVIRELNIARQFISITLDCLANDLPDRPIFTGLDQRYDRAVKRGNRLVGLGVALLIAGFVLQAVSVALPCEIP